MNTPLKISLGATSKNSSFVIPAKAGIQLNQTTGCRIKPGMTNFKTILISLALTIATPAYAEELGRLFFTPEQRALLERGQQPDTGKPDKIDSLTVNGIVQKHGGERTVWINGVPQPAGRSDEKAPESVPVAIPGQSQPAKVKVGQKVIVNPATPEK